MTNHEFIITILDDNINNVRSMASVKYKNFISTVSTSIFLFITIVLLIYKYKYKEYNYIIIITLIIFIIFFIRNRKFLFLKND